MFEISKMNFHPLIITFLLILILVSGCKKPGEINPTNILDCESLKNIKKDECYASLSEKIVLNDGEEAINICSLIQDSMIKDLCYLDLTRNKYLVDKKRVCFLIEDSNWKERCIRRRNRPHIWGIIPKN